MSRHTKKRVSLSKDYVLKTFWRFHWKDFFIKLYNYIFLLCLFMLRRLEWTLRHIKQRQQAILFWWNMSWKVFVSYSDISTKFGQGIYGWSKKTIENNHFCNKSFFMGGKWGPIFRYLHYNSHSLINFLCILDLTPKTLNKICVFSPLNGCFPCHLRFEIIQLKLSSL